MTGTDVQATLANGFSPTATITGSGNQITVKDSSGFEMVLEARQGACETKFRDPTMAAGGTATAAGGTAFDAEIEVISAGQMVFQIGANQEETMTVTIPNMSPKLLGLDDINVVSSSDAREAIDKIEAAIQKVSDVRAKLGAYQNRLEHTEDNLDVSEESMTNSLSRIMDCDMAEEMTNYTHPESILQLLQQG